MRFKNYISSFIVVLLICFGSSTFSLLLAQGSETFTNLNAPGNSYGNGSYTGDGGVVWTYGQARSVTATHNITGRSCGFASSGNRFVSANSGASGVGTIDFSLRSYFTGGGAADRTMELWVNGTQYDSFTLPAMSTVYNRSITVNEAGNVTIEFISTGTRQIVIDDVSWTTAVTCTSPTVQASANSTSGITFNDATIGWTRGNGDNVLVVLQAGSAAGTPSSGTSYTANSVFGSGDAIGSGFVVYNGNGTSVSVSNLTAGTTYHYAIYEYDNTNTCYNTTGLAGTFTTTAIGTSSDIISSGGESATVPSNIITPGPLTSAQGVKVWDFTIRDGGASGDSDPLPTILDDLVITQGTGNAMNDWDIAIKSADLFDGTTHLANGLITANQIAYTGLNITTADDASKTLTLRISLNCPANSANNLDGDDFVFRISQANVTESATGSSQFDSFTSANSTNGQNVYDIITTAITSITPTTGPVGTVVTINAAGGGFIGATSVEFSGVAASGFTVISDSEISATVAAGTITGDVSVTDAFCYTDNFSDFTIIDNQSTSCEGRTTYTDLFISEIFDAGSGDVYYYEVYNGTGAAVNLTDYRILQRQNGGGTTYNTVLAGTLADGQTYVIGNSNTECAGVRDQAGHGTGINDNDGVFLQKNPASWTTIDRWGNESTGTSFTGGVGYTYTRKINPVNTPPFTGFDETGDWDQLNTESCADLGNFNTGPGSTPSIDAQPTTSQLCAGSDAVLNVSGSEGFAGGLGLAYQWYQSAPGANGWTALSNGGVISGANSATLTISPADGYDDYQFYCQVRENTASCYTASDAVQLDVYGQGGTDGLWTGATSTDWCNCLNWDNGRVPNNTTDVTIDETAVNNCVVGAGCATAVSNSIEVGSVSNVNNSLTVNNTSNLTTLTTLTISKSGGTGNLIVEVAGNGTLSAGNTFITGNGGNNAILRNQSGTAVLDINGNLLINANGLLDLNSGGTLNLAGNYSNNNSALGLDEAGSTVILDGAATQTIDMLSFTETFNNLTLNKSGGIVELNDPIIILNTGILDLTDDQLRLNGNEITINNSTTGAITRTSGSIIDEYGTGNAGSLTGKITWNIATVGGNHEFPFATSVGGTVIPFIFNRTAGNAGNVSVSTYGTGGDNLPWPSFPENVTNLNSTAGLTPDNRDATADRFWQIDTDGSPTADITFSYATNELPVAPYNSFTDMIAQRYNSTSNQWEVQIYPGQTRGTIAGGHFVTVPNITTFSPWTLSNIASPLPAELSYFSAEKVDKTALLKWETKSEINVDRFEIERSNNGIDFANVITVNSSDQNSTNELYYSAIDYQPLNGDNYYRLKTIDYDGQYELSKIEVLNFSDDNFSVGNLDNEWVLVGSDLNEYDFKLVNSLGQTIALENISHMSDGNLSIRHDGLSSGVYLFIIEGKSGSEVIKLMK